MNQYDIVYDYDYIASLMSSVWYWGNGVKLIYRHYATLYFVFAVDQQESDLGILDLIQGDEFGYHSFRFGCLFHAVLVVFVETLDKCFENVCELDLIFHSDKVGNNHLSSVTSAHFNLDRFIMCWMKS